MQIRCNGLFLRWLELLKPAVFSCGSRAAQNCWGLALDCWKLVDARNLVLLNAIGANGGDISLIMSRNTSIFVMSMFEALDIEAHGQQSHDVVLNVVAEKWRTATSSQGRRRMMTSGLAARRLSHCPCTPNFTSVRRDPNKALRTHCHRRQLCHCVCASQDKIFMMNSARKSCEPCKIQHRGRPPPSATHSTGVRH